MMNTSVSVAQGVDDRVEGFVPQVHAWVQLRDRPSLYSDDQALLLCEISADSWVAWVPNHGETIVHREHLLKP